MSDKLPSIDNLPESKLPSLDEFIVEEKELPSIDEFVEKEEEVTEEPPDLTPCSVEESQDLTEIVRLINDVRKDIPDIPEVKYYDEELEKLTEQIEQVRDSIPEPPEIPEIKYYDDEIASLREEIDRNAADIPEIKYYDEQVNDLEEKIRTLKEHIGGLPEPKYYEEDLESLKEDILAVKESIPVFPKWVNEVNQVPDFSWIGKTFGVIDDDFSKVNDHINDLKDRFNDDLNHLTEDLDKKDFEKRVSIEKVTEDLKEAKDKIYKELKETALSIHDTKHGYKNDDRLLKKDVLSKLNVLKQRVEEEVKEFNRKNVETKDIFDGYFTALTEEIANLPKPKNYDNKFRDLRRDVKSDVSKLSKKFEDTTVNISELYKIVEDIKGDQQLLLETNVPLGEDPPETSNKDPLTPIDQNFVTLEQLQKHYKLFVERVQYQLGSIGGGGAGFIKDLDDVSFEGVNNQLLIYNSTDSKWVGIASTALSGSSDSTLDDILKNGNVTGVGMSVGVITATNGYFSGIVTATTLNYDVVSDIYSTGIVTATKGIQQTGNEGLHVTAGVSTFVGLTSCLGGLHVRAGSAVTSLIVEGDGRVTGILTIGTGSITLDAANNKVSVGTGITLDAASSTILVGGSKVADSSGQANYTGIVTATGGVHVGTAATIYANGNISCGILTATNFIGDGSGLTGVANTDNVVSTTLSVSGVVTAIGGLYVGTAASIFANGNIAAAGIVTANGGFVGSGANITAINASNIASGTIAAARVATLNQDTTGNAATATALETARNIGGVSFDGSANINLPGVNQSGNQDTSGNATTATTATNITVSANNSTDETVYPIFVDGATGGQGAETDTGLTYNPSDGNLTATTFTGALTGNASGSSGSCTGNAAGLTGTPNITVGDVVASSLDISGNADIDGTLEADAITVNGTALDTHIAGVTVTNATNAAGLTGTPDITVDEVTARNLNISGFTTITSTDTGSSAGPIVELYRNSSSPADADYLGQIKFQGENDNDEKINYAKITGKISDASDGSEDGIIEFAHIKAGSQNISGRWNSTTLQLLNGTDLSVAGDIDLAGDIDVDGTLEADAITVNGTALDTHIAGVTVTTATNATNFACSANNSTDETVYPVFVDGATGNQGAETDTGLSYNPNSGTLTAAVFSGSGASLTNIPGVASESDTAVSSTSATTVATLSASTYRAAIVDVVITQGSAYQAGQYGLIHDGTTATIVEQWAVATGSMLGTFTATISGGNMLMQVNMGSSSSATVTVKTHTITV